MAPIRLTNFDFTLGPSFPLNPWSYMLGLLACPKPALAACGVWVDHPTAGLQNESTKGGEYEDERGE